AMPALAAATAVVVAVIIYARLHGLSPAASMGATAASLVVCAAAALAWRRIPQGGRDRMGRGLRWPRSARVSRGTAAALAPVEGFVRGVRDVLEGDAALLWALVVVVVGLLLLRAAV
ncbi:MAG TPA: hypothetical protein VK449_01565, partial [Anaerolineales bacterium]|nr:hypothetical protein [Anaerolineales bacterium]